MTAIIRKFKIAITAIALSSACVTALACGSAGEYESQTNSTDGIKFFEGTWTEALQKSKAEHKPIFLDLYATWCGPCKMLKRKTFSDKGVGDFFNQNFINVELDGESGDGLMLAQKFQLNSYPSLYIVDSTGTITRHTVGYHNPDELIDFGKSGLTK